MSTLILRTTTRILTPIIAVVSIYLLLRGHDAPGGGFIGGLVAGSIIVLQYFAWGFTRSGRLLRLTAGTILGAGLTLAAAVGLAAMVAGGEFLEGAVWKTSAPVIGELKVTASLFFDIGVFLVVVGAVVGLVRFLGEDPAP